MMNNMNNYIKNFVDIGVSYINQMNFETEYRIEKIKEEYRKTFDMPRKMKKKIRKELNLDYSIATSLKNNISFFDDDFKETIWKNTIF